MLCPLTPHHAPSSLLTIIIKPNAYTKAHIPTTTYPSCAVGVALGALELNHPRGQDARHAPWLAKKEECWQQGEEKAAAPASTSRWRCSHPHPWLDEATRRRKRRSVLYVACMWVCGWCESMCVE